MTRNPNHPWAPSVRDPQCLAFAVEPSMRKKMMRSAKAFPGCHCLWCIQAATPRQPMTLWPACKCETCDSHILWRQPQHFMRVCEHGHRWTIDSEEPDDCELCRLDELEKRTCEMKQQLSIIMDQTRLTTAQPVIS